jgi:hypothetical protein
MDSLCKDVGNKSIEYSIKSNKNQSKKRNRKYSNLMNSIINNDSDNSNNIHIEACIPKKVDKI